MHETGRKGLNNDTVEVTNGEEPSSVQFGVVACRCTFMRLFCYVWRFNNVV